MIYSHNCLLFLCISPCEVHYKKHRETQFLLESVWNRTACVEGAVTRICMGIAKVF